MYYCVGSGIKWAPSLHTSAEEIFWQISILIMLLLWIHLNGFSYDRYLKKISIFAFMCIVMLLLILLFFANIYAKMWVVLIMMFMPIFTFWISIKYLSVAMKNITTNCRIHLLLRHIIRNTAMVIIIIIMEIGYFNSAMYFYPSSYSKEVRKHLEMICNILNWEIEQEEDSFSTSLSEAHYYHEGIDLIPRSLRKSSEYENYAYLRHKPSGVEPKYMDVLPLSYNEGDFSFLVIVHNDNSPHSVNGPIVNRYYFTIHMADRDGMPALPFDPEPHDKRLLTAFMKRLVYSD